MAGKKFQRGFLSEACPHLLDEWHPELNQHLDPNKVYAGSKTVIWWICSKNKKHIWDTPAYTRSNVKSPRGCPFCAGQRVHPDESIEALHPEISKWWDNSKNKLKACEVLPSSDRKVWWKCEKGHEFPRQVKKLIKYRTCTVCSGRRITLENCLSTTHPHLINQWDFKKNKLSPDKIGYGSSRIVWWKCKEGPDHEWKTAINMRTGQNTGCPFCANRKLSVTNSLETVAPEIAQEFHPIKNGNLTPKDIIGAGEKKYWWQCLRHKEHQWQASMYSRIIERSGCPKCTPTSSGPEIRIFAELKLVFDDAEIGSKVYGNEIDVYLPSIKLGIEYDGYYWHDGKEKTDIKKNRSLTKQGIKLIRVREEPLPKLSKHDLIVSQTQFTKSDLNILIHQIIELYPEFSEKVKPYLEPNVFLNDKLFNLYRSYFPSPFPEKSLLALDPEVSRFWDYEKNSPLRPENFRPFSNFQAWWKCPDNPEHQWQKPISSRRYPFGCVFCPKPFSLSVEVDISESLLAADPEVSRFWDYEKNSPLKPENFRPFSNFQAWWKCPDNPEHQWQRSINSRRTPFSCVFCPKFTDDVTEEKHTPAEEIKIYVGPSAYVFSPKVVEPTSSLQQADPTIVQYWDYQKNEGLSPDQISPFSTYKAWWKCPKDPEHQWEEQIAYRQDPFKCKFCPPDPLESNQKLRYLRGARITKETSFGGIFPELAKQWHPDKNVFTPFEYSAGSGYKAWWICEEGHEYSATIDSRTRSKGSGCPFCVGHIPTEGRSFGDLHPDLLLEWDYEKNQHLNPFELVVGSSKKAWWKCDIAHDHRWAAEIRNRTGKSKSLGCPFCSGRFPSSTNNLLLHFPEICIHWDYTNNDTLPNDHLPSSRYNAWWICPNVPEHRYQHKIINRVRHVGCKKCGRSDKKRVGHFQPNLFDQ